MDLTIILDDLITKLSQVPGRLRPYVLGLCFFAVAFEIIREVAVKGNVRPIILIRDNILAYIPVIVLITYYEQAVEKLYQLFNFLAGKGATGVENIDFENLPSDIIEKGFTELYPLWEKVGINPATWVYGFLYIAGLILIIIVALQVFLAFLEYAIIINLGIVFLPLSLFSPTREWGNKMYSVIFSQSVKIFVITFTMYFLIEYLKLPLETEDELNILSYLSGIGGMSYMISKVPAIVGGFFSGVPALGGVSGRQAGRNVAQGAKSTYGGFKKAGSFVGSKIGKNPSDIAKQ